MIDHILNILNPERLINVWWLMAILLAVFAETWLLVGIFLPGDSLLFTAWLLTSLGIFDPSYGLTRLQAIHPLVLLVGSLTIVGIIWDQIWYIMGRKTWHKLYQRPEWILRKKKYLVMTEHFYHKYGWFAIIAGRFVPIIRTIVPALAGVIGMDYRTFIVNNIIGCVLRVWSFVLVGYFLGKQFPAIKDYLEYIVLGIIFVSLVPIAYKIYKEYHLSKNISS